MGGERRGKELSRKEKEREKEREEERDKYSLTHLWDIRYTIDSMI